MERYKNLNGDSGIAAYEIHPDSIRIQFKNTAKIYATAMRVLVESTSKR